MKTIKKRALITRKRYIFLGLAMVAAAAGLLFFEGVPDASRLQPDHLLLKAMKKGHYVTSDELAGKIIDGDPSLLLVDLRDSVQYTHYSLPNALNVPVDKILDKNFVGYFDQDQFKVVLYSNDYLIADQAWLLLTSKKFSNLYVLKGGLNEFFRTIIQPQEPLATAPKVDFEKYNMRQAASYYFGVPMPRVVSEGTSSGVSETGGLLANKKRKAIVIRKKKKKKVGGC